MGTLCCPGPEPQKYSSELMEPLSESIFMIENKLQSISLQNKYSYYWIDPKIKSSGNQKCLKELEQLVQAKGVDSVERLMSSLKNADPFSKCRLICAASLKDEEFQTLQQDSRIQAICLFCQNKQRAADLIRKFPKVKEPFYEFASLKESINKGSKIQKNPELLFLIEDHIKTMNKSRINFYSLTSTKVHKNAKDVFVQFAKKFYPSSLSEIDNFQSNYQLDLHRQEKIKQTLFWLSKADFFYKSIQLLPRVTLDPKKLAYLRFPINEAYHCIYEANKAQKTSLDEAFVVIVPSQEEIENLTKNRGNFVMFPSFIKGWRSEKKAKQKVKEQQNSILIRIIFSSTDKKQEIDYGYCLLDTTDGSEDVIFNIFNFFEIKEVELQIKQVVFQYGSLSEVVKFRQKQRGIKMNAFQSNLLKNYDYLEDILSKIESQAPVLQMSGHFKDSLRIYKLEDQLRRSQSQQTEEIFDKHLISIGDAHALNKDFDQAEKSFKSIRTKEMKLIGNVHLADLYYKMGETKKLQEVLKEINENLSSYRELNGADSFRAQNYIGLDLMNKGEYKKASIHYKNLMCEMSKFYDLKYEAIPLVHEITRNRAACETKLSNYDDALSLLNTTIEWQRVCEGVKSPGLIITENLIKSLHESKGETQKAQQCTQRMKSIYLGFTQNESLYETRKAAVPSINQSAINVATTGVSRG